MLRAVVVDKTEAVRRVFVRRTASIHDKDVVMLVIISDLHLTDGSSGETISPGAFRIFADRLRDLAYGASWRVDGNYRPIEQLDLVLLGDVLDVIRSSQWSLRPDVRPWDNPYRPDYVELVTKVTTDILHHNSTACHELRDLARAGALALPPATGRGMPASDSLEHHVNVRMHYMVGNHDWFFHLRGTSYDLLRQAIVHQLGLANSPQDPFPHDPSELLDLQDTLRRHKVFARHGDLYDPFNFEGDRDASSLGDAIVIELINRFAITVEQKLADDLPLATLMGLRELDNVRPIILVPVWIDGLLTRTCPFPAQRKAVKQIWDRLADDFLSLQFVRDRDTWNPNDLVDGLQKVLKFSKHLSVGWASTLLTWLHGLTGGGEESYYRHALTEQDFRNRRAKHIVYGHTHHAECLPLDASYAEGFVLNQMYFNSGTWRRVHRQTQLDATEHEFIASDVMSYLAFFQGDERGGRPYETWSGTLGLAPAEFSFHRIDAGKKNHATRQSISTPNLHRHHPHFAPPTADAPVATRRPL